MKLFFSLILVLTITASLFSSTVVLYDPQSPGVTNRVIALVRSADTPQFSGLTNALINPTLPGSGGPSDWKVSGGNVVALTGGDLTAIANARAAEVEAEAQLRERFAKTNAIASATATALDVDGRLLKAMAEVTMDEINVVRAELTIIKAQIQLARTNTTAFQHATNRSNFPMNALADRTMTQLRTAINSKLSAQADNN